MRISRKDFLLRSTAAVIPASLATTALGANADPANSSPRSLPHFNVRQFGAQGDSLTKDTKAIQAAIDAAGALGDRLFPPGGYLSGTVRLRSNVTVFLDAGATLMASPDKADFDPYEKLNFKSFSDDETTDFHYALGAGAGRGAHRDHRPRHH